MDKRTHFFAYIPIIAQQAIGLIGESAILSGIGASHVLLRSSIERFIAFDAASLLVMLAPLLVFGKERKAKPNDPVAFDEEV